MIVVVDTNIYFSALYNPKGNEGEIIRRANAEEITLLSPDIVKEELDRVLQSELDWSEEKTSKIINNLPVVWVPKEEYTDELSHAKSLISHEPDSPILACASKLETGILTGNTNHFDTPQIGEEVPLWSSRELLQYLESGENAGKGDSKNIRDGM